MALGSRLQTAAVRGMGNLMPGNEVNVMHLVGGNFEHGSVNVRCGVSITAITILIVLIKLIMQLTKRLISPIVILVTRNSHLQSRPL